MQTIVMEMMALASGVPVETLEPLRGTVLASPTPFSVVDTAVIDNSHILLIRRADNGLWAMPGGTRSHLRMLPPLEIA